MTIVTYAGNAHNRTVGCVGCEDSDRGLCQLAPVRQARAEAILDLVRQLRHERGANARTTDTVEVWIGKLLDTLPPGAVGEGVREWTLGRVDTALNDLARAGLVRLVGRGGTLFIVLAVSPSGGDVHSPSVV